MIKYEFTAIIKKDLDKVVSTKTMFLSLLAVPLVLTVLLPTVMIVSSHFIPQEETVKYAKLLKLMPVSELGSSLTETLTRLMLNYMLPLFFLIIPIMASTIMSASSFVGEKEKQTLETLLYSPLSLKRLFQAKTAASFLLSMSVSAISFFLMLIVLETELYLTTGTFILPGTQWLLILLLLAPSLSVIAITLMVRISAKAQSVEDAQQGAVFLILPVILLCVSQFGGIFLINSRILLGLGILCAVLAWVFLKRAAANFTYESLNALI